MKDVTGHISLICAAANGHTKIVQMLLNHSANIEAVTNKGSSALMQAVSFGLFGYTTQPK